MSDRELGQSKIEDLLEAEGYRDHFEFMEDFIIESVVPGICMTPECGCTTSVEPDCENGWCELCGDQTVKSGLVLMGIM